MRSIWIAYGCITMATIALVLGYFARGMGILSPLFVIFGILWVGAIVQRWRGISSLAFVIFVFSAAYAAWKGSSPLLMLLVVVPALSAWDLDAMISRFQICRGGSPRCSKIVFGYKKTRPYHEHGIEQRHLIRLAAIDGVGLILGVSTQVIKLRFGFVVILVLSFVVILGLSQLVLYLRRSSD